MSGHPTNENGGLTPQEHDLVLQYTPLVRKVARSLPLNIPAVLEYEDAVSFGMCGLIEAVQRYDPERDQSFTAYAARRIRGSIIDAFRRLDWQTRTMRQRTREIQRIQQDMENRLGRGPSDAELGEKLGLDVAQVRDLRAASRWVTVSLNRLLDSDADGDAYHAAERPQVEEEDDITAGLDERELRHELAQAVAALPERERLVVQLYYAESLTMREVAEVLGVSETRVSQIHARAVQRLRRAMRTASVA